MQRESRVSSSAAHETFLELHGKTPLQHAPEQLKWIRSRSGYFVYKLMVLRWMLVTLSDIFSVYIQKLLNWFLWDLVQVLILPRGWTVQTLIPSPGPSRSIKLFKHVPPQKNPLSKYVCIMMMLQYSDIILLYSAYSTAYVSRCCLALKFGFNRLLKIFSSFTELWDSSRVDPHLKTLFGWEVEQP